jgi:hypothetical protein
MSTALLLVCRLLLFINTSPAFLTISQRNTNNKRSYGQQNSRLLIIQAQPCRRIVSSCKNVGHTHRSIGKEATIKRTQNKQNSGSQG